jgi:hypothetical protein
MPLKRQKKVNGLSVRFGAVGADGRSLLRADPQSRHFVTFIANFIANFIGMAHFDRVCGKIRGKVRRWDRLSHTLPSPASELLSPVPPPANQRLTEMSAFPWMLGIRQ